jgi:hypothetical protein
VTARVTPEKFMVAASGEAGRDGTFLTGPRW